MVSRRRRLIGLFSFVAVLAAAGLLVVNRWNIYDYLQLRGYTPPTAIAQLATDTTMNPKTRRLFYVYHPSLEDKDSFRSHCTNAEKTIVLGCFITNRGIYLSNISDPRLAGITQVTAAHETLHAAYDRLSPADKKHVDAMILAAYSSVTDQRIRDTIDNYKKDGADTTNELHSILGTEVRDLPPELDQYYARYFTNRLHIVAYSEAYEAAFSSRKVEAAGYLAQMDGIKKQIDSLNASLDQKKSALENQYASLQSQRSHVSDVERFNAQVASYNAQVNDYNAQVRQVASLIDQYNAILAKYNAVADEESQLVKAIDSRPATIQSQ
jgi:hypothetical protein